MFLFVNQNNVSAGTLNDYTVYTVPAGKTFYVTDWWLTASAPSTAATGYLQMQFAAQVISQYGQSQNFTGKFSTPFPVGAGKTINAVQQTTAAGVALNCVVMGYLE